MVNALCCDVSPSGHQVVNQPSVALSYVGQCRNTGLNISSSPSLSIYISLSLSLIYITIYFIIICKQLSLLQPLLLYVQCTPYSLQYTRYTHQTFYGYNRRPLVLNDRMPGYAVNNTPRVPLFVLCPRLWPTSNTG